MSELQNFCLNSCRSLLRIASTTLDQLQSALQTSHAEPEHPPADVAEDNVISAEQSASISDLSSSVSLAVRSSGGSSSQKNTSGSQGSTCMAVESTREYPNGDVIYDSTRDTDCSLRDGRGIGWATLVYSSRTTQTGISTIWKSCLGVYQCPMTSCSFTERPRVPRLEKKNIPRRFLPKQCVLYTIKNSDTSLVRLL